MVARKLNWPTQQAKANTTGEFVCLGRRIETSRIGILDRHDSQSIDII